MPEQAQFEALVDEHLPALYRYACWLSGSAEQAEDLVQETLLRAWSAIGDLREPGAVKAWLTCTLRREFARGFERKRLDTVDLDDIGPDHRALGCEDRSELLELRQVIGELEMAYREPIVLQVLMGYTTREIAQIMDLTQGAVLTRLHRARQKLMEKMNADALTSASSDGQKTG